MTTFITPSSCSYCRQNKKYLNTAMVIQGELDAENVALKADLEEAVDALAELMEWDSSKDLPERDTEFLSVEGKKAMAVLRKHKEAK